MRPKRTLLFITTVLLFVGGAKADWLETNRDGVAGGGLDYLDYWVASWNGSVPNPATDWYTAAYLSTWYGSDPGWTGNVVNITDADTTAYVAANKFESFTDVRATVSVSTTDLDEEFGVVVRASDFDHGDPVTNVSAYAATFNANNALNPGDPMEFNVYKIVNGQIVHSKTVNPIVPSGFDDLIVFIELTAGGSDVTARLFDDAGSATPLAFITLDEPGNEPLPVGYSGVISLDYESADGISAYYDTLWSGVIPEPATFVFLGIGTFVLLRKRR